MTENVTIIGDHPELLEALQAHYMEERDALLKQVSAIEKRWLGYGTPQKPTTAQLRGMWRDGRWRCASCGRQLAESEEVNHEA